jgi:hypothetical protein
MDIIINYKEFTPIYRKVALAFDCFSPLCIYVRKYQNPINRLLNYTNFEYRNLKVEPGKFKWAYSVFHTNKINASLIDFFNNKTSEYTELINNIDKVFLDSDYDPKGEANYLTIVNDFIKKDVVYLNSFLNDIHSITENIVCNVSILFVNRIPNEKAVGGYTGGNYFYLVISPQYLDNLDLFKINRVKSMMLHELVHVVNLKDPFLSKIKDKLKTLNLVVAHIFEETFTQTIMNIAKYNLKYSSEKFSFYYNEKSASCSEFKGMEDSIRKLYLKWELSKEISFSEFLYNNYDLLDK